MGGFFIKLYMKNIIFKINYHQHHSLSKLNHTSKCLIIHMDSLEVSAFLIENGRFERFYNEMTVEFLIVLSIFPL